MALKIGSNKTSRALAVALASVALMLSISVPAAAQSGGSSAAAALEKGKGTNGPRKQLATIVFAGLGGAVLGLSTLSFYGRPQENLRNIAIGAAFGLIGGTIIVTYRAATNPAELYGEQRAIEDDFESTAGLGGGARTPVRGGQPAAPLGLKLAFDF